MYNYNIDNKIVSKISNIINEDNPFMYNYYNKLSKIKKSFHE